MPARIDRIRVGGGGRGNEQPCVLQVCADGPNERVLGRQNTKVSPATTRNNERGCLKSAAQTKDQVAGLQCSFPAPWQKLEGSVVHTMPPILPSEC